MSSSAEPEGAAPGLTAAEQDIYDSSTSPLLDLSLVHQRAIPGIWNQVKFPTFPANWLVIGHKPGGVLNGRKQMVLQGEGPGGLKNAAALLRDDEIQYAGFRVSVSLKSDDAGSQQLGPADAPPPDDVFVVVWAPHNRTAEETSHRGECFHDAVLSWETYRSFA